jgi:conjugal transfer/entry exclusion protein
MSSDTDICSGNISKNYREAVMYFSCLMLRNLSSQPMSAAEQLAADEQLGQMAAAVTRATRCIAERAHAVAALPVRSRHQARTFRNPGRSGRRAW